MTTHTMDFQLYPNQTKVVCDCGWKATTKTGEEAETAARFHIRADRMIRSDERRTQLREQRALKLEAARTEAARRNAQQFGTDPSWYGR